MMDSQCAMILDYCAKHGSITVREASEILFINSPTARISELRKSGLIDHAEWEFYINKDGKKKRFLRYFMKN